MEYLRSDRPQRERESFAITYDLHHKCDDEGWVDNLHHQSEEKEKCLSLSPSSAV